jgi:hypothetical protein
MRQATVVIAPDDVINERVERLTSRGFDPVQVEATLRADHNRPVWKNDRYTVIVNELGDGTTWLSIRRNDRKAARDWRDFQRIKNDICGPEREAVELYPAESRLVDTSNQFHLWVAPAGKWFDFGFDEGRHVSNGEAAAEIGAVQRPLER